MMGSLGPLAPIIKKKLMTKKLFFTSLFLIGLTFLAATFWESIGLGTKQTPLLAFIMMIAFGINIAGVIMGINERKKGREGALFGIMGNLLLILVFLSVSTYALVTMH
jgi:hypothetical protein